MAHHSMAETFGNEEFVSLTRLTPEDLCKVTPKMFQVQYDETISEEIEPLHTCRICSYETKYEKEYNIHMRTHTNEKQSLQGHNTINSKIPNTKSAKNKKIKLQPRKNTSVTPKIQLKRRPPKPNNVVKEKRTKIVFQCSICDEIFPNEIAIKNHAKKDHGNENIVVSEESEYEDIQTLESEEEEMPFISKTGKYKNDKTTKVTNNKQSLDFLEDWIDDDDGHDLKRNSNFKNKKLSSKELEDELTRSDDNKEDIDEEETAAKPTCMFCNATFLSFESVQDHVKMTHRNNPSLKVGLQTGNSLEGSTKIDNKTDILANKKPISIISKPNVNKRKWFKCNICGIRRVSWKFITKHIIGHKRKMALQCKLCGSYLKTIIALKVHQYRCHKIARINKKCPQCRMVFVKSNQLKIHIKKVHRHPKQQIKALPLESAEAISSRKIGNSVKSVTSKNNITAKNVRTIEGNLKISSSKVSSTSTENCSSASLKNKFPRRNCKTKSMVKRKGHLKKHVKDEDRTANKTSKGNTIKKANVKKEIKCLECNISLSKQSKLVNHMLLHKSNKCLGVGLCFYCDKVFLEKDQLILHINAKHDFRFDPKCTLCGKTYSHHKDLKLHYIRTHFSSNAEYLLDQLTDRELKSNLDSTKDNDVYSKVFKQLQDLTGEGNDVEDGYGETQINYSCPLCDFNSTNKDMLKTHLSSHPQHYCNICKSIFSQTESIKHIENHTIEFQNKKCSECDETFHDNLHLQCHLRAHSASKMFKCSMCDKSYFTEKAMLIHKSIHGSASKKVFSCTKCKKNFFVEKDYETHIEFAHRAGMNCKYCDKTLNSMKKLIAHENNHLKHVNNVLKCPVCGKVLKTHLALKKHKLIHNSNVSLPCEVCNQGFKSFQALREHSATHSNNQEKKFFCDVCGKGFYFYNSHLRHRRLHLDPLLFKCKPCGERFQTKQKLLQHKTRCSGTP